MSEHRRKPVENILGWGSVPKVRFVLENYTLRSKKSKRFVLRIIHDTDAIDEMSWFEEKTGGGYGAIDGKHDDMVMSRGIALLVNHAYAGTAQASCAGFPTASSAEAAPLDTVLHRQ